MTATHSGVVSSFKETDVSGEVSDDDVVAKLREGKSNSPKSNLQHLLSKGKNVETLLHYLLKPETDELSDFDKLEPLIRFLLKICPAFPIAIGGDQKTPL